MQQVIRRSLLCLTLLVLSFPAMGAGLSAGTSIQLLANASFSSLSGAQDAAPAVKTLAVVQSASVAIEAGQAPQSTSPGMAYHIPMKIINTGNGTDTIKLTASSSTGWSTTFVRDDNSDGIKQISEVTLITGTGLLTADAGFRCFASVVVPSGATTGSAVTITAASTFHTAATAAVALNIPAPSASAPKVITTTPINGEAAIASGTNIVVTFDQAMDRQSVQTAINVSPALDQPAYNWSADSTRLAITHAGYSSGTRYDLTMSTAAKNASGISIAGSYSWSFHTASIAQFEPDQALVDAGAVFTTPAIVLNDSNCPASASFTVGLPGEFGIDATSVNGNLICVQRGADASAVTSTWNAQTREIAINVQLATPGSNVELVKGITLTAPITQGTHELTLGGKPALAVSVGGSVPGDFNDSGQVDAADLSMFDAEWVRWRRTKYRIFDPAIDGIYDLATRSNGPWPNWTPIGDKTINIWDATAFVESWVGSTNPTMAYDQYVSTSRKSRQMFVTINSAPYKMFQANITLPNGTKFNATTGANGNLLYVFPQNGAGNLFYSEYDAASKTIRITGTVSGSAPYYVALIYLY